MLHVLTIAVLLLSMPILRMMILHAVRVLILGIRLVVVTLMAVLILPEYLVVMTYHRPGEVMEGVRAIMTAVPVAIYVAGY